MTNKSTKTRNNILATVEKLFNEKNIHHISVHQITEHAGIGKGTFYLHFESKDQMVLQFVEERLNHPNNIMDTFDYLTFQTQDIHTFVRYLVDFIDAHKPLLNMMFRAQLFEYLGHNKITSDYLIKWLNSLERYLEKGMISGELKIKDPHFTALFLQHAFYKIMKDFIMQKEEWHVEYLNEQFTFLINKLLK